METKVRCKFCDVETNVKSISRHSKTTKHLSKVIKNRPESGEIPSEGLSIGLNYLGFSMEHVINAYVLKKMEDEGIPLGTPVEIRWFKEEDL